MFCPQCGTNESDELKFCKSCGANLAKVRQVVGTRETSEKFDWNKTWVTEMFLSPVERERRKQELELQRGITPEVKRLREVKAGVITASAGVALAIFLYVFMQGIILGGKVSPDVAEILSRLWVVGVIPLLVGIALLINGLFVRTSAERASRNAVDKDVQNHSLPSGDTPPPIPAGFSVTEQTTRQLQGPDQKQ
jgi:hypothetical protein